MARMTARLTGVCWMIVAVGAASSLAQDVAEVRGRLQKAYQQIQTYQATITHETSRNNGRWRLVRSFDVAFDRSSNSLRIDRPDMLLIADGKALRYRSEMIPGRHVEVQMSGSLDWGMLLGAAPFLSQQMMPDVMLLLGADPVDTMGDVMVLNNDYFGRPGLQFDTTRGRVQLRYDPDTYMITQAKIDQSASFQRGDPVGPSTVTYDISVQKRDDQFDQEWFVFDRSNSQAVRRWGELLAETDVDTASLEGSDAPSLELRTIEGKLIKLSEIKQDVVVLCFWASWGGPQCYRAFPVWQQIADSAAKQGESVAVFTVNLRESESDVKQVWQVKQLTLPVLMDKDGAAASAYRVGPVPQTVVIHKGTVMHTHVGMPDDFKTVLQSQVASLVKGASVTRK